MLVTMVLLSSGIASASSESTCFPLSTAIRALVENEQTGSTLVVVEETTACEGVAFAPATIDVPKTLFGREALVYVVEAYSASVPKSQRYGVYDRAGGWFVAPETGERVADLVVSVDPAQCATVFAAERCILDQVVRARKIWFGLPVAVDESGLLPNSVSIHETPVLEALRTIYGPHERVPIGFVIQIDTEYDRMNRPGRRDGYYGIMYNPLAGVEVAPMPIATPETAFSPPQ